MLRLALFGIFCVFWCIILHCDVFWRFFFTITALFLPVRTSSMYDSTYPVSGRQTPCTRKKLCAKMGLILLFMRRIGFVLHKKCFLNLSKILIFRLRTGFSLGKIGFVWVRFGFVLYFGSFTTKLTKGTKLNHEWTLINTNY